MVETMKLKNRFYICASLALLTLSASAFAAEPLNSTNLKTRIQQTLKQGQSLKAFYSSLNEQYGSTAIKPLVELLSDRQTSDEVRWASLFALARLAGKESIGMVQKSMTDPSWLLRDAALKTAAALDAKELTPQIEKRLKDDALIVRTTAVQTIGHLNLTKSAPKLVDALFDPINFHAGKALWIHKHILQVIKDFNYTAALPQLVKLLASSKDEQLQLQLIQTLEKLTGKSFSEKPVHEQVYLWKRVALADSTF
jgi:hypothetical protein